MIVMTDAQRDLAEKWWTLVQEANNLVDGCNPENGTPEGAAENQKKADAVNAEAAVIAEQLRAGGLVLNDNTWEAPPLTAADL